MPAFAYSAINAQGLEMRGRDPGPDVSAARDSLRGNGLLAQWIEELRGAAGRRRQGVLRPPEEGQGEVAAGVLAPVRNHGGGGDLGRRALS